MFGWKKNHLSSISFERINLEKKLQIFSSSLKKLAVLRQLAIRVVFGKNSEESRPPLKLKNNRVLLSATL